jgi:hypothetical protein
MMMNDSNDAQRNRDREEVFSKAVRAGKRTYFFDVKATKSGDNYLTITESKRRFDNDSGKFSYEKHKIFLFKEDFDKFSDGYEEAINFIKENLPVDEDDSENDSSEEQITDVDFDDLDK